jgi:hypothetical protein
MVIELIRLHRADERYLIRTGTEMRQKVAKFHAALTVHSELPLAAHQARGFFLDEGESNFPGHRFRKLLAIEFAELGLGSNKSAWLGAPSP